MVSNFISELDLSDLVDYGDFSINQRDLSKDSSNGTVMENILLVVSCLFSFIRKLNYFRLLVKAVGMSVTKEIFRKHQDEHAGKQEVRMNEQSKNEHVVGEPQTNERKKGKPISKKS